MGSDPGTPPIDGLCLPDPNASAPALFHRLALLKRRPLIEQHLKAALQGCAAGLTKPISHLLELFEKLDSQGYIRAVDHPMVHSQLRLIEKPEDRALFGGPLRLALGLARFLIGAIEHELIIPAEVFVPGGLFLPHLNALLMGPGPVAVMTDAQTVSFTWTDGHRVTVPRSGLTDVRAERFRALPTVLGLALLNEAPELSGPIGTLLEQGQNSGKLWESTQLARGFRPPPEDLRSFEEGLALLESTWPQAIRPTLEVFSSLFALPHRGDGRFLSLTSGRMRGVFICGIVDPLQVGDSLIHEGAHNRLWPVFDLDPLLEDAEAPIHPSPWRADPRPLKGVLNGVHAFLGVCAYYRRLTDHPEHGAFARYKLDLHWPKVLKGWEYLSSKAQPTPLGRRFLEGLEAAIQAGVRS